MQAIKSGRRIDDCLLFYYSTCNGLRRGALVGAHAGRYALTKNVFHQLVTPKFWERIVAGACADAMEGEARARDWLVKVLGAENVVDAQGLVDEQSSYVPVASIDM